MEAKYCIVVLVWLAAFRRGDCFVLSNATAFINTNAEEPADEGTEFTFIPSVPSSLASEWYDLQKQSGRDVVTNEMTPPEVEGDIDNTTTVVRGRNVTGQKERSNINILKIIALTSFALTVGLCVALLVHMIIKFIKRTIWHSIYQFYSTPTDIEMSTIRYNQVPVQ